MNNIVNELKETNTFYLATVDGSNQPHVRPFSSITEINGELYICTNNTKNVYQQLINNNVLEICGMKKDGSWIRVVGKAIRDDSDESRKAMLDDPTGPSTMYTLGDGIFEVFRVEDIIATKYSFRDSPRIIEK